MYCSFRASSLIVRQIAVLNKKEIFLTCQWVLLAGIKCIKDLLIETRSFKSTSFDKKSNFTSQKLGADLQRP